MVKGVFLSVFFSYLEILDEQTGIVGLKYDMYSSISVIFMIWSPGKLYRKLALKVMRPYGPHFPPYRLGKFCFGGVLRQITFAD